MNARLRPIVRIVMLTLFGACTFLLPAQEIDIQSDDDKPLEERIVYGHQNTYHIAIHSQGFGGGFKIGKNKTIGQTRYWQVAAVSLHSLKEIKSISSASFARSYVYGKRNSAFALRVGYGNEKRLYGKPYWGGVETRWTYEAGATLGWMKPYYYTVVVYKPDGAFGYVESQDEQTFENHEQWIAIEGRSSFIKGFNESKLTPGIHASTGLCFDFAKKSNLCQSVNVDVIAEGYPMGLTILDSQRNRWFFVSLMLSYHWGSRFNKY